MTKSWSADMITVEFWTSIPLTAIAFAVYLVTICVMVKITKTVNFFQMLYWNAVNGMCAFVGLAMDRNLRRKAFGKPQATTTSIQFSQRNSSAS
ncbi:unnamed protein product, partial [Mesorhabditis spiculigera]